MRLKVRGRTAAAFWSVASRIFTKEHVTFLRSSYLAFCQRVFKIPCEPSWKYMCMLKSLSVDEIMLPRNKTFSTYFKACH